MAVLFLPRLSYVAENQRILQIAPLGTDESWGATTIHEAVIKGKPLFWNVYPDAYFLTNWMPLMILKQFRSVSITDTIVVSRTVSLACYVLVGVVVFLGMKRYWGAWNATLACLLTFTFSQGQDLVLRATACQPDLMNLLVFTVAFFGGLELVRTPSWGSVFYCGAIAGLAMGVKFSGFLLLPVFGGIILLQTVGMDIDALQVQVQKVIKANTAVLMAVLSGLLVLSLVAWMAAGHGSTLGWLPTPASLSPKVGLAAYIASVLMLLALVNLRSESVYWHSRIWGPRLAWGGQNILLLATVFAVVFFLAAPNTWFHLRFIDEILYHTGNTGKGAAGGRGWGVFHIGEVVSPLFLVLTLVGASVAIYCWWSRLWKQPAADEVLALLWAVVTIGVLFITVSKTRERYLYPALPCMFFFSWYAIKWLLDIADKYSITRNARHVVLVCCLVGASGQIFAREIRNNRTVFAEVARKTGFVLGDWLRANMPKGARIMTQGGVYVPLEFENVAGLSGGNPYDLVKNFNPEIVIIEKQRVARVIASSDSGFDEVLIVPAKLARRFYYDMINGKLGFQQAVELNHVGCDETFVVYRKTDRVPRE